jgi:hypothetical protein
MIRETSLPHGRPGFQSIRKSSFDELHGPLQRNLRCRRHQYVNVIRHDHEFIETEFSCVAVVRESVDQKFRGRLPAKDRLALGSDGGDEEGAVAVHFEMVAGRESLVCERSHKQRSMCFRTGLAVWSMALSARRESKKMEPAPQGRQERASDFENRRQSAVEERPFKGRDRRFPKKQGFSPSSRATSEVCSAFSDNGSQGLKAATLRRTQRGP